MKAGIISRMRLKSIIIETLGIAYEIIKCLIESLAVGKQAVDIRNAPPFSEMHPPDKQPG